MVKGYRCNICSYETKRRGYLLAQLEIKDHIEDNHPKEYSEYEQSKEAYYQELKLLNKKYPKMVIGYLVTPIDSKPSKKWRCPDCGEEMPYGRWKI